MKPQSQSGESEFLFERKHWNMLLQKLPPSIRLKTKKNISFSESIIVFGPDNEDDSVVRKLSLDLSLKKDAEYLIDPDEEEIMQIEKAIGDALIATLVELKAFPRGARNNGELLCEDDTLDAVDNDSDNLVGFVYLVRNKDLFKIGITIDLKRRMDELRPDEIINTVKCKNFRAVERDLHSLYKTNRIPQTEYFRLDSDQVEVVQRLMMRLAEF